MTLKDGYRIQELNKTNKQETGKQRTWKKVKLVRSKDILNEEPQLRPAFPSVERNSMKYHHKVYSVIYREFIRSKNYELNNQTGNIKGDMNPNNFVMKIWSLSGKLENFIPNHNAQTPRLWLVPLLIFRGEFLKIYGQQSNFQKRLCSIVL